MKVKNEKNENKNTVRKTANDDAYACHQQSHCPNISHFFNLVFFELLLLDDAQLVTRIQSRNGRKAV